jgi:pimeloyl-ACP methyl ester carboxylesterase
LLVFLCAALPEPGKSLAAVIAEGSESGGADLLDSAAGQHLTPREQAREIFFYDLPVELQDWALDRQRAQAERPHRETSPLESWPNVPVVVANGRFDRCISLERARRSALRVVGTGPVELDCGHFPFLSHVGLVADELDRLAREDPDAWPSRYPLQTRATPDATSRRAGGHV